MAVSLQEKETFMVLVSIQKRVDETTTDPKWFWFTPLSAPGGWFSSFCPHETLKAPLRVEHRQQTAYHSFTVRSYRRAVCKCKKTEQRLKKGGDDDSQRDGLTGIISASELITIWPHVSSLIKPETLKTSDPTPADGARPVQTEETSVTRDFLLWTDARETLSLFFLFLCCSVRDVGAVTCIQSIWLQHCILLKWSVIKQVRGQ